MRAHAISFLLILTPGLSQALDIENAKRINRTCALCHGAYGQGTPGTLSPRLAGLPEEYLAKELRYYRDGVRNYDPMVVASSVDSMTDKDIDDISEYLAGVDLRTLNLPKVPRYIRGDAKEGERYFMEECKSCHRPSGLGKEEQGIPPVAGQYGSYLFGQMKRFQKKERYHDDDPEDETFDDLEDKDLDNLVAFVTTLPAHPPQPEPESFQLAMAGMSGMIAMASDGTMSAMQGTSARGANPVAGRFRVLPSGDIVLSPTNQDMRSLTGLSGDFQITNTGILFMPR